MLKSQDLAEAILAYCADTGHRVTLHKLQMLMFFAQGWHLAEHDEPLFDERIDAGPHGPIIASVEKRYKGHGIRPIQISVGIPHVSKALQHRVEDLWNTYGEMPDFELEAMIRSEEPYRTARADLTPSDPAHPPIANGDLWAHFQDMLAVRA